MKLKITVKRHLALLRIYVPNKAMSKEINLIKGMKRNFIEA
jgi:hypothetical protein